jgi:hypothetical protein
MILRDVFIFAKKPKIDQEDKVGNTALIKRNAYIFLINLSFTILGSIFVAIISSKLNIVQKGITNNKIHTESVLIIGLINLLVIPFIEELANRLYLIFKPINIAISISILFYSLISFINQSSFYEFNNFFYLKFAISVILGSIVYFILKTEKIKSIFEKIWLKYFKYIFYFSVLSFGLYHISKYSLTNCMYLLAPLLVIPQIISGIIWGYVRVKYGIFWSVLQHIIHNVCFYLPMIIIGVIK